MNNHDVPRSPSRFGLPQVKDAPYHQLAHDWLLRDGETYRENRELGTRRARAAALMELGLPGSAYVYQGEELGLFEVANIPWDRLEDPTPFNTRRNFTDKGRDGCRAPMRGRLPIAANRLRGARTSSPAARSVSARSRAIPPTRTCRSRPGSRISRPTSRPMTTVPCCTCTASCCSCDRRC